MRGRPSSTSIVLAALLLSALVSGCGGSYSRLEATVAAQGERLELLARTPTPAPTVQPTPSPVPTHLPTPSPLPTSSPRPAPTATATQTVSDLLEGVLPSVVRVTTGDSVGTGFVVRRQEVVLTALHVVRDDLEHVVVLTREGVQYPAVVTAFDERRDLALLAVPGFHARPLAVGAETLLGDMVLVVGYSASLPGEPSVARGIISAKRLYPVSGVAVVQTDATMNPGSSGGPLLSERGEVLGVNSSRIRGQGSQFEGLGFAIAASELSSFQDEVEAGQWKTHPLPTRTPTQTAR